MAQAAAEVVLVAQGAPALADEMTGAVAAAAAMTEGVMIAGEVAEAATSAVGAMNAVAAVEMVVRETIGVAENATVEDEGARTVTEGATIEAAEDAAVQIVMAAQETTEVAGMNAVTAAGHVAMSTKARVRSSGADWPARVQLD